MNTEMDKYKVDHLVILVDGKTSANNYFAKQFGSVSLLCTEQELGVAKKLRISMRKNMVALVVNEPRIVDGDDGYTVQSAINGILRDEVADGAKIGLDYTGGTKSLAIHACSALRFSFNKQKQIYVERENVQFSYIDDGKMIIENFPQKPTVIQL